MEIEVIKEGPATVVKIGGRLNASSVGALEEHLQKKVEEGVAYLILDLSSLEYVSSAGLRVLLLIGKQIRAKGSYMALCGLNSGIQQVFSISGFFPLFNTFDSRQEALAIVQAGKSMEV